MTKCDSDCDKCGDCKEIDKLNYCKKKENASKIVCKNFEFFQILDNFNKRQKRNIITGSQIETGPEEEEEDQPDPSPEPEPQPDPEPGDPGDPEKEILPELPNISAYTSWRPTFKNTADIFNELRKENFTVKQINDMISVAELSSLNYHPYLHQLASLSANFIGPALMVGGNAYYAYEKRVRDSQIRANRRSSTRTKIAPAERYDHFEEEFGPPKQEPPKRKPSKRIKARDRAPRGESTRARQLKTTSADDVGVEMTGPDIEDPDMPDLEDIPVNPNIPLSQQTGGIQRPPGDPPPDPPPGPPEEEESLLPPKTQTIDRDPTPEDKQPLIGAGDEPSTDAPDTDAPDTGDQPDPTITADPEPIEEIDPFQTALNQFTIESDVTFTKGYQYYLENVTTKGLAPEKMLPSIRLFYNTQVQYYDRQIPILQSDLDKSFDLLQEDLAQVNAKNLEGAAILEKIKKSTSSTRPALIEQANQIKTDLQILNTDLQSQRAVYNTNYTNYKKTVDDKNYFRGQDSGYEKTSMNPQVITDNETFTEDIEPKADILNFASDNADSAIQTAKSEGISWAAEQQVKVVQAIESYNDANDANINISQGEIEKIINGGGDYESSITSYYDTFKQTQLNLVQVQKDSLTAKFNLFKSSIGELESANQDVLAEIFKFNAMKTDGSSVEMVTAEKVKISGMLDKLSNLKSESTASYTAYFNQKGVYDSTVNASNQAIKDVNSKYKNPPVPDDVKEFEKYGIDTSYTQSEIMEDIQEFRGIISKGLQSVEAQAELQALANSANETTLEVADANITQLEAQLKNAQRALTDAKTALTKAMNTATTSTNAITKEEGGGLFLSAAQNDIKTAEAAKATYDDVFSKWSTKRNLLIDAIQDRNTSDSFNQLTEAGEITDEMSEPASTSEDVFLTFRKFKNSNTTKISNLGKKFATNKITIETLNLQVTDYTGIKSEITNNKRLLKNANTRLANANKNLDKPNLTDAQKQKYLAKAKLEQDAVKTAQQDLLNSQNEEAAMLSSDKQERQAIITNTDDIVKNELNLPVDDTVPDVYQTQMDSLNTQMSTLAEDITDTMAMDPEINFEPSEIQTLISGLSKSYVYKDTSIMARAVRTMRSSKVLYTDLFSRFNVVSPETSAFEITEGVEEASLGARAMSGTAALIGAGSSFISRAIMTPLTFAASTLTGAAIGGQLVSLIGRSMGPIGMVLTLAGAGFQIWVDMKAQPPANFAIQATDSTRDNLVMPLPAGAPDSLRDTTHDQYGLFQTTSYLNYMKYYLNDTDKFQTAINGGFSAMDAYRSVFTGFPLVYHSNTQGSMEGRGGMTGVSSSPSYYSVDYTNPTEGQAYSYFQLMYNSIKQKYNTFVAGGMDPTKAMNLTITTYQGQVKYAQDNNRPLYVSRYTQDNGGYAYGSINGYSEKDTAKALAEFKENPYVFAGLPKSTLTLMGLPDNINDLGFLDSDQFKTITQNNSFYQSEYEQVQKEVKIASANAQVASFKKLISNIPDDQTEVKQYFLYQLDQLQQDPLIASDLTGLNKMRDPFPPPLNLVQQDFLDILNNPYYFSINAAWDAQTDQYTSIDEFSDDNLNSLPSWFSLDPTDDNNFNVSTIENAKLATETSLQQQLGLYDYNQQTMGSEGGKIFQDTYTYHTDTLTNVAYDLQKLKQGGSGWYLWLLNSPDQKNLLQLYQSYYKQYQLEGVDDAMDSAYQTIVNQLQLSVDNGDDYRIYTETSPTGLLVNASSAMGALNSSQLAYYQALYNEDHTRYMGYNDAALLALGLNSHLANGELFPGETVDRNNRAVDPDLLSHFTSMISNRDLSLQKLEINGVVYGQPIPVYEQDGKFSGTYLNPSDTDYDSTFQTEFPTYNYATTGYDPYATTTQTQETQNADDAPTGTDTATTTTGQDNTNTGT